MGEINVLSNDLINKIAAGEVIERPASIVKELVENSIDAGATEITIEIENGGITYIKVSDNGKGIYEEDIEKAFMRHATSKIKNEQDLFKITSLGFRGEALASIASISKVELTTKTKEVEYGVKVNIENGIIKNKIYSGATTGTSITVRDIFYNVPARLKFLKSPSREQSYITEIVENLALSNPQISFKYITNKKLVFVTKGDGNLKNVIYVIYGKNIYENLIEVNCSKETISLKGFIGNSKIEKNNRNYQSIFVNGRYIKNKTITAAIENAYKSMLSINKFPFFIINLFINPELIDVNVHPTKAEIKFSDEQKVFKEVYTCIKECIINNDYIPSFKLDNYQIIKNINDNEETKKELSFEQFYYKSTTEENNSIFYENIDNNYNVAYFEENSLLNNLNRESEIEQTKIHLDDKNILKKQYVDQENTQKINYNDTCLLEETDVIPNNLPIMTIVGQIHFTYIITETSDGFYLIDQHAAHERILYEKYLNEFINGKILKQILLTPIILEFSLSTKEKLFQHKELLYKLGFEFEDFGGNSISLRSVPNNYTYKNYKQLLEEILQNIENDLDIKSNSIDKLIYTMACKNAIKAGDKLNFKEIENLIKELDKCKNPYTCPHGRPTMIKFDYIDIEKKFKRIM